MRFLTPLFAAALAASFPASAQDDFAVPPAPHIEDYFVAGLAPVRADPRADVTIIYFMDYQCPACRRHTPDVSSVFGTDHGLKVIYRDTPIFGPNSVEAAKFAIASQFQGRHEAFHRALMAQPLPLDNAAIRAAAAKAGVDWARLERDRAAHAKAIDAQIAQNQNLSEAAGISGTPAYIIGKTLANGALDAAGLRGEIADARAAAPKPVAPQAAAAPPPDPAPEAPANEVDGAAPPADDPSADAVPVPPGNDVAPDAPAFEREEVAAEPDPSPRPAGLLPAAAAVAALLLAVAALLHSRRRSRAQAE